SQTATAPKAPSAPTSAPSDQTPAPPQTTHPAELVSRPADRIQTNGQGANRIFSSPLARRLARESGIDIARVQGSGPHGRVVARDIEAARSGAALKAPAGAPATTARPTVEAPSDDRIRALFEPGSYEVVPHDNMRKIIARRLTESKQTIPHFYLTLDCTIDTLLAAREEINAAAPKGKDGKPAYKLSVNDFVIKALA